MALASFQKKTLRTFRGAWLLATQSRDSTRGTFARNVRFDSTGFFTREGFFPWVTGLGASAIQYFYNWLIIYSGAEYSRIIYLQSNGIYIYFIGGGTFGANPSLLYSQTAVGLSIAEADTRLYIGHHDANGVPSGPAKILEIIIGTTPAFSAFSDPVTPTAFTVSEPAGGVVTAGLHYYCFRIETSTGFPGRVSPTTASRTSLGGQNVRTTISLTTPVDALMLHIGMTTVANPARFIEVASVSISPGVTTTINTTIDISDESISALPDSADMTDYFSLLTLSNNAPYPAKIIAFGNRNVYIAGTKAYISDPYNPQWLLEPDNVIQVEGQRRMVTSAAMGGLLVLFGPNWTFAMSGDNYRKPREWAPPVNVSERIGTMCINGATPSSGQQFLWVAHESGLYTFDGNYSEIPVSYNFKPDWDRINWVAARGTLQMEDDATKRCLIINVPVDGSTVPNRRMVIDYTNGIGAGDVSYSMDDKANGVSVPSIGRIQNFTTKQTNLNYAVDGKFHREDSTRRQDDTDYITSDYETGLNLAASEIATALNRFGGIQVDVAGSGVLAITPYGLGRVITSDDAVDTIHLVPSPDGEEEVRWHMQSENQTVRFFCNDGYFKVQKMSIFSKPAGTTKAS